MTTAQLVILDLIVAALTAVAWLATGVAAAVRRPQLVPWALVAALLMTAGRVVTVVLLAGRGWWFVAEKTLLNLPLLGATALVALALTVPYLRATVIPTRCVVALLTTAYAALAGLGVTFVAGYPLTRSTALITCSVVVLAALLTERVIGPAPDAAGSPVRDTKVLDVDTDPSATDPDGAGPAVADPDVVAADAGTLSRRRFVGLAGGAVAVGTGAVGTGLLFVPAPAAVAGGGPPGSASPTVSVADLRGARTPASGGTVRSHTLTARKTAVRLPTGERIPAWTYGGRTPGPSITAVEGDLIDVTLRNADIDDGVTAHWHGYDIACGEDGAPGVTQPAVMPGETFRYRFRADQVGTYWYHTHQLSYRGVRRGLFGTLIVKPRGEQSNDVDLTLPVHTFDGVVVFADTDGRTDHEVPPGSRVRLRLVNTDSDPHRFALVGTPFHLVAVDGRDLHHPSETAEHSLRLPAGGRYDLSFVMPDAPVALQLDDNRDRVVRLRPDAGSSAPPIPETASWPELDLLRYGEPADLPFDPEHADRHFTLVLDRGIAMVDGKPAYAQTVNGRGHPSIPDQLVAEGDVVRLTVVNRSVETHPWHLHGHPVVVLSRNGTRAAGSPLWVDTFDVRPGEVWEVAFRANNPGVWMNHCHNLPHAHAGMMLRLRYDTVFSPYDASTGSASGAAHGHGTAHGD